jgi:hypothetical protein
VIQFLCKIKNKKAISKKNNLLQKKSNEFI